eukprot:4395279-Lingulodinium_polyedra.AAC.1
MKYTGYATIQIADVSKHAHAHQSGDLDVETIVAKSKNGKLVGLTFTGAHTLHRQLAIDVP